MLKTLSKCVLGFLLAAVICAAQQTPSAKPPEHMVGTVTAVDQGNQSVTFKQDKTATEYTAQLAGTRTILSVPPGTKPEDLKKVARRITSADIQPGDRIELYYFPSAMNGNTIAARAAVLMSARSLEAARTAEAEAWQHSTIGVVSAVDAATHTLKMSVRTPEGATMPVTLTATGATQFTRYSAEDPKTPAPSKLADIQTGDIVRVVGDKSPDGSTIAAQKVYLAPRQLPAVVVSISGNELTVKDLRNKQNVMVAVNSQTQVRRLPPQIAYMLARRLNPSFRAAAGGGNHAGAPPYGAKAGEASGTNAPRAAGAAPNRAAELSRLIESTPEIQISELKPGDAVVISGAPATGDHSQLLANTIVAGVEPIFQSAPPRQGQSLGNWSLDMAVPEE
jgi:hypothetical protein